MSEAERQETDILLPPARVAVFSEDGETLSAIEAMRQDWRFARVSIHAQKGNVQTAISYFENGAEEVDLLIIQTEDIDDKFTDKLGELSAYCNEGTSAIVIGPVNDVYLYRRLIAMGVTDYLVRPVKAEILSSLIAKTLVSKLGVSGSRLIACIGAKGGVGTTVVSQCFAWGISQFLEQKTMLLDAAGGNSALSVGMGFDPTATLAQVIRAVDSRSEEAFSRLLFKASEKLSVIAAGSDPMLAPPASAEQYERLLDQLMVRSPVVIVDVSGSDAALRRVVASRANKIILTTVPTVTSLRLARQMIKEVSDLRGGKPDDIELIVTQQGLFKAYEVPSKDIEEALEHKVSAVIPFLPAAFLGNEGDSSKFTKDKDLGVLVKNTLMPIVKALLSRQGNEDDKGSNDASKKNSGVLGGILNKFTTR